MKPWQLVASGAAVAVVLTACSSDNAVVTETSLAAPAQESAAPAPSPSASLEGVVAVAADLAVSSECSLPSDQIPTSLLAGESDGASTYSNCLLPGGGSVTIIEADGKFSTSERELRARVKERCKVEEVGTSTFFNSFIAAFGEGWIAYADNPAPVQRDFVQLLSVAEGASTLSCGTTAPGPILQVVEDYQGCVADDPQAVDLRGVSEKANALRWGCKTDNIYDFEALSFDPEFRSEVLGSIPPQMTRDSNPGLIYNIAVGDNWLVVAYESEDRDDAAMSETRFRELIQELPVLEVFTGTTGSNALVPGTASTPSRSEGGWTAGGGGLFWRWIDVPGGSCDIGDVCWAVEVEATESCSNGVYAEISIKDANGRVIDWTNDTVASLAAGEVAELQFDSFEERADKAFVTTLRCWP